MTTTTAPHLPSASWSGERRFFTSMSFAILAAVLLGFSRSFYLHGFFPTHPRPTEAFFTLHGVVFTAWFVLLCAQALLIANRRADLHRALGVAGAALAAVMVVVGMYGAVLAAARATGFVGIPVPGWAFLAIPLVDMLIFPAFVAMAVARRRDPQAHKRWMLIASIAILTPACARWPVVRDIGNPLLFFFVADLFFIPLLVRDLRTRGRLHPATAWGIGIVLASQPLRLAISQTDGWHAFASALIGVIT